MKKTLLLFAACSAMALAIAGPLADAGFSLAYDVAQSMPLAAIAFTGLALYLVAPAVQFVARHVKQALAMSLQPGGRSPAVALIASKSRHLRRIARDRISITSTWRMCPST